MLKVSEQKSVRKVVSCEDYRRRAWCWRATRGGFQNPPVRAMKVWPKEVENVNGGEGVHRFQKENCQDMVTAGSGK